MTGMGLLAPVRLLVTVSVAERVCVPAVFKVAVKTPTPADKVLLPGSVAAVSLLEKATVPV